MCACRSCRTARRAGFRAARSARYNKIWTHLVIDRRLFSATLYKRGVAVFRTRVGVGKPYWPTPAGRVLRPRADHGLLGPDLRPDRLRDERPLRRPDRLARRRLHRDPRDEPAGDPSRARLARLRPHAERRDPSPRPADAARDAGHDPLAVNRATMCSGRSAPGVPARMISWIRTVRRVSAVALGVAVLAVLAPSAVDPGDSRTAADRAERFVLSDPATETYRWAFVRHRAIARDRPSYSARALHAHPASARRSSTETRPGAGRSAVQERDRPGSGSGSRSSRTARPGWVPRECAHRRSTRLTSGS